MGTLTSKLVLTLVDNVTNRARGINAALATMQARQRANTAKMNAMRSQMLGAAAAGYALYRGISAPIKAAMDFESSMADVKKVVDFPTPQAFKEMKSDILGLSQNLPMTAQGIAEIVAAAGQAGMKGAELLEFSELAAKVGVAFDMSAGQTGEALAKIKTALQLSVADTRALADAINHLSNTSASSAPDLIDYMKRVGAVGTQYGFTAQQTAAIGSAMIASGAEANVAATSFRNVGKALTRGANATKKQNKAFKALGLNSKTVAKQMQKDAVGTLRDVILRIQKLPKHLQAANISGLFGDEARAIAPLVGQIELFDNALGSVAQQSNYLGSSQKEYEARAATTANAVQLLQNQFKAFSIAVGDSLLPGLNKAVAATGPYVKAITKAARENPELTAAIVKTASALVGMRIASAAARFALLWVTGGYISAAIAGLKSLSVGIKAVGTAAVFTTGKLKSLRAAMVGATMLGAVGGGGVFAASLAAIAAPIATAKGAFVGLGAAIAGITWPIWASIAAVAALGLAFRHYWEPISNFVSGFVSEIGSALGSAATELIGFGAKLVSAIAAWGANKIADFGEMLGFDRASIKVSLDAAGEAVKGWGKTLVSIIKAIPKAVGDWAADLFSVKDYSDNAEKEFRAAGRNLARAMIDGIKALPGKIVSLFKGLGKRIMLTIGSIDFNSLIPSWAQGWLKGDEKKPAAANDNIAKQFGGAKAKVESEMKGVSAAVRVQSAHAVAAAKEGGKGISEGLNVSVKPVIDVSSIDGANAKVRALGQSLRNLPNASVRPRSAVAGARAAGGAVVGGQTYLVGEQGAELYTPGRSGYVHNARDTAGMTSGGRGPQMQTGQTLSVDVGGIVLHGVNDLEAAGDEIVQVLTDKLEAAMTGIQNDNEYAVG